MNSSKFYLGSSLALMALALPALAFADTYQIIDLGNSNGYQVVGVDPKGDVFIYNLRQGNFLVDDWVGNQLVTTVSSTMPSLTYDDPPGCNAPAGYDSVGTPICDNGYVAFASRYNPNGDPNGIYVAINTDPTPLAVAGSVDGGYINASGDFAWTDGVLEQDFEAIDLTTSKAINLTTTNVSTVPEPSSLLLLTTGLLGVAGVVRHRWR